MAKEKNVNPVQAAKKAEKQKQLKKQKATVQAQRNEKLARKNPHRLQRDIENLKSMMESGDARPHDRQRLSELERELAAVNKARETLGDQAPEFKPRSDGADRGGRGGGVLGKRTRDGQWKGSERMDESDTDEDVKGVPMPRGTPPPVPEEYRRRLPPGFEAVVAPVKKPQIVYEAAPQERDLRKEATRFVPASVQAKIKAAKGETGKLLEPEEFDRLKEEGYMDAKKAVEAAEGEEIHATAAAGEGGNIDAFLADVTAEWDGKIQQDPEGTMAMQIADNAVQEVEHKFIEAVARGEMDNAEHQAKSTERILHQVEIEEVEDEDL